MSDFAAMMVAVEHRTSALEFRYSALEGTRDRLRKAVVWLTGALHDESPEHAGKSHAECDVWECIRARTVLAETADTRRTPTPQERTELNEALELAGNVADEAWQMGLNVHAAKKLASALISLAAESEELRALLNQETNSAVGSELATSKMWRRRALDAERESEELRADLEKKDMVNEQYFRAMGTFKAQRDDLESRYTALEKALRDAVEAADAGSGTVSLKELRRILALTPKEGE